MPIVETASGLAIAPPKGIVEVELRDARTGRLRHRETSENFVGPAVAQFQDYIQTVQYLELANSALNFPSGSLNNLGRHIYRSYPISPAHIVAYSGTNAEVPASEEHFWGELIAWAACDATYSGSDTQRGTFTQSAAEMTSTTAKWVFDWVVGAGNGTIGSIGWGVVHTLTANKALQNAFCDYAIVGAGIQTDTTAVGLDFDGTYFRSAALSNTNRNVYKLTTAGALDSTLALTGGTGANCYGLAWDSATSTMRLLTAASSSALTAWNIERYATGGGAMVSSISVTLGVAGKLRGLTFDGTDFWVTNQTTNEILRINPSGTVTATLANPFILASSGNTDAIAWDGTNLIVKSNTGNEMVAMNTSGTVQWRSTGGARVSSTDYGSGGFYKQDIGYRGGLWHQSSNTHSSSSTPLFQISQEAEAWAPSGGAMPGDICMYSGQIIGQGNSGGSQYYGRIRPYGLWSRTLLGTPVTKTSSETMRISYSWAFA